MGLFPIRVFQQLLLSFTIVCSGQALGDEVTTAVGENFKGEKTYSAVYQYGWLSLYGVSSAMAAIRSSDAEEYDYRESHALLSLRSAFGVYKFLAQPLLSHGAYERYQGIMNDGKLNDEQKKSKVLELNREVALDQQKKRSMRGLIIGTAIHSLVALRINYTTEDEYFAGRAFLSGMAAQVISMLMVPQDSLTWYQKHNRLDVSLSPDLKGGFQLGLSYQFH